MTDTTIKLDSHELELIKATLKVLNGQITETEYLTAMSVLGYKGTTNYSMFLAFALRFCSALLAH